jgi:hypothetical protein
MQVFFKFIKFNLEEFQLCGLEHQFYIRGSDNFILTKKRKNGDRRIGNSTKKLYSRNSYSESELLISIELMINAIYII